MLIADSRLQELLLEQKILNEKSVSELWSFAQSTRLSLQDALLEKSVMTDLELGTFIAQALNVPFIQLAQMVIPEEVLKIIPERIARKYKVIAFFQDKKTVHLGMVNPFIPDLCEMVGHKTGKKVVVNLVTERDIDTALQKYRSDLQQTFNTLLHKGFGSSAYFTNDAPVEKIVDMLITSAYREKASDIHIEPEEDDLLVRFRVDSILYDVLSLDKNLHSRIITRIKVLSNLRTDEHYSAQDGKMRLLVDDEHVDIRVSIIPITEGEKVVLRLLSSKFRQFSLPELGMRKSDLKKVMAAVSTAHGMILSTGPTGSGKTTSIYSILKILNTREKNITTIEDPVEYKIRGVNQIQVNTKTNLTFAQGLRSILRQDPNVIFVGEIRDSETAGIAVNAALTGHLVVSTLHTNDAATALPRLVDMKVEPFLVASTVTVIIAQRLVRKICESCKEEVSYEREKVLRNLSEKVINQYFGDKKAISCFIGKGCSICHFTGFAGRIGIFEVIEVTEGMKKLIIEKKDSDIIERYAIQEGMTTMLDDGLSKVAQGVTTLEEILRVVKTEPV